VVVGFVRHLNTAGVYEPHLSPVPSRSTLPGFGETHVVPQYYAVPVIFLRRRPRDEQLRGRQRPRFHSCRRSAGPFGIGGRHQVVAGRTPAGVSGGDHPQPIFGGRPQSAHQRRPYVTVHFGRIPPTCGKSTTPGEMNKPSERGENTRTNRSTLSTFQSDFKAYG